MKKLKPYIIGVGAGLLMYVAIFALFHPFVVSGPSMEPTFYDQNFVLSEKIETKLDYGDVVIANMGGKKCIKRVVALPGDSVRVEEGILYVNGVASEYNYAVIEDAGLLEHEATLFKGEYVLLGDNRNNSLDSRDYGPVKRENILYRVTKKII